MNQKFRTKQYDGIIHFFIDNIFIFAKLIRIITTNYISTLINT